MADFDVFQSSFAQKIFLEKYSMNKQETWSDTCKRVVSSVCGQYLPNDLKEEIYNAMLSRKFIPGGRYLYAAGRELHQIANCFSFKAEDSREGWSELTQKVTNVLMTGGGIGVVYSKLREEGALIKKTGGFSTGPIALMKIVDHIAEFIQQGGFRRSACWAGLQWDHKDAFKFINMKNWTKDQLDLKSKDQSYHLPMEGTNISVIYNTDFFVAIENKSHPKNKLAQQVWQANVRQAFMTGEPGMSFNYCKDNEDLRNACCEFASETDSDSCNLGTVWMDKCKTKEEFARICHIGTVFLLCGGMYSDTPYPLIRQVRDKNNRIGLGLGGMYEWLASRSYGYQVVPEMHKWLNVYEQESDGAAYVWSKEFGIAIPKGKRAIAPNGTTGLLAESTTAMEPLLAVAYTKEYLLSNGTKSKEYIIDSVAKRLMSNGVPAEKIKDAYSIPFVDRVKFQADVQNYVDMAISSTCNIGAWGSELNNEETLPKYSKILLKYAKRLRGFTCYPDGSRSQQPMTKITMEEALANQAKTEHKIHECYNGVCGL
jgi:ribonucleoside-diphosphate reductase alpha chain